MIAERLLKEWKEGTNEWKKFESFGFTYEQVDCFAYLQAYLWENKPNERSREIVKKYLRKCKEFAFITNKEQFENLVSEVRENSSCINSTIGSKNNEELFEFANRSIDYESEETREYAEELYFIVCDILEHYADKANIMWWLEAENL
jgi:hypothetical protein